jgi:hypothetical protein
MAESRGVVYIATGKQFVDEALISAASVKRHMPDIGISLFTDLNDMVSDPPEAFDEVFLLENPALSCRDKIKPLAESPFHKTLFLDTDTYLCEPVYDLFDMLDRFDIALAQAPDRYQYALPDLPDCFTELNSGVIAYRKSQETLNLLALWEKTFVEMLTLDAGSYRDQHSLRDSLYRSDASFFVLPPEYNFRTICPNFAGKHCAVKIIHGRHADMEKVAARLNSTRGARIFLTSPFRYFTSDLSSYDSLLQASMNACFQSLPGGMKRWLSGLKARFSA